MYSNAAPFERLPQYCPSNLNQAREREIQITGITEVISARIESSIERDSARYYLKFKRNYQAIVKMKWHYLRNVIVFAHANVTTPLAPHRTPKV